MPTWQLARRMFKADLVTKVFNSVQESLMDLAVNAELEFSSGMFSGSAAAKVGITKKDGFKTLVTSATLDVQLVQLSIAKYAASDINQDLVADFNNLPTSWTRDPLAFQGFLARWGTHVLVRLGFLRTFLLFASLSALAGLCSIILY